MDVKTQRKLFDQGFRPIEAAVLTFKGVEKFDVYNCSIPFAWQGKRYIFGRIEGRTEWMRSWVRLFEETGPDTYTLVPDSMIYQLEDPFISIIHNQLVLGGTHVRLKEAGALDTFYGYFYRGGDLMDLRYFTTGPRHMKDIRLVELADGKIGVFSRPKGEEVAKAHGSSAMIGFAVIDSLDQLGPQVIENAPYIEGLFQEGEWGGCNQAYLLSSGLVGVTGHLSYRQDDLACYLNMAFVLNPATREVKDLKIIGTRNSYPTGPAKMPPQTPFKRPLLSDCAFTSGIVMRPDGKADLYSGIGDAQEGWTVIDYPFAGFGEIVTPWGI